MKFSVVTPNLIKKPKTEVHTDNRLPPSMLSGRVSHSSSGDRRVP
jgi:hypothetical protein